VQIKDINLRKALNNSLVVYQSLIDPALTFFSALKLATRLKHDESSGSDSNKFNDYYLVGNLLSVSVALFYTYILHHTHKIETILRLL
jgi:hypothetical protein